MAKPSSYYDQAYYDTDPTKGYPGPYNLACAPWGRIARALIFTFGILGVTSVTDFGCARGFVLWHLKNAGWATKGYDFSEYAVQTAMEGLDIEVADVAAKRREFQAADLALCMDVLEHIDEKRLPQALTNMRAATGKVFVAQAYLPEVDYGPINDMPEHVTVKPREWWTAQFDKAGFRPHVLEGEYKLNVRRMCLRPFGEMWAGSSFVLEKKEEEPILTAKLALESETESERTIESAEDRNPVAVEPGWQVAHAWKPTEAEIFQ